MDILFRAKMLMAVRKLIIKYLYICSKKILKKVKKDNNVSSLKYYCIEDRKRVLEAQKRVQNYFSCQRLQRVFSRSTVRWLQRKEVPFMGTVRPLPRRMNTTQISVGKEKEGPQRRMKRDDRHYGNTALSQHRYRPCTRTAFLPRQLGAIVFGKLFRSNEMHFVTR